MLQTIREKTSGWFAWVLVIAIAVVFAIWGIGSLGTSSEAATAVAKVNGEPIEKSKFMAIYQREQKSLPQSSYTGLAHAQLQNQVLEGLVMDTLQVQDANKAGFLIGKKLIDTLIMSNPAVQVDGKFSPELYQQLLAQMGMSSAQYYHLLGENISRHFMRVAIAYTEFMLPSEVDQILALSEQKRDIEYVVFPLAAAIKETQVSDKDIAAYYESNKAQFKVEEKVAVNYVLLSLDEINSQLKPTEEELNNFYEQNAQHFAQPEERKLRHILFTFPSGSSEREKAEVTEKANAVAEQAKSGEDFTQLAKAHSNDVSSAEQGGDLGWLPKGVAVKPFDDAVFAESKENSIVGPIQTPFGLHVVKIEQIHKAKTPPFAQIRDHVLAQWKEEKASQIFLEKQEELAQIAYENPTSLETVAKKMRLQMSETPLFSRQTGDEGTTITNPSFVEAAFSESVLGGNNSTVITVVPEQKVVVLRLAQHKPEKEQSLAQVKSEIEEKVKRELATKALEQKLQQQVSEMNGKQTLEQFAHDKNLSVVKVTTDRFQESNYDPYLLRSAFSMPKAAGVTKPISMLRLSNGDYAVVQLNNIYESKPDPVEDVMMDSYMRALTQIRGELDYKLYTDNLRKKADIRYYGEFEKQQSR